MKKLKQKTSDFVIVGSGIAGLNTALNLAEYGKVLIVTKKRIDASSTFFAQGGIAAVIGKDDNIDSHIEDTLAAGYYHNKKQAVDFLVKGGSSAVSKLIKLGVPFDKNIEGHYLTSYEAAHSYPRVLHATDFTGKEIENVLAKKVLGNRNIEIWKNTSAHELIVKNNICYGVTVLSQSKSRHSEFISESPEILKQVQDDNFICIFSRATILATGGAGQVYEWTTNPSVATGDGIAIAYRAGAKLADLEFMQFHPTALKENSSPLLLLSEALRGEGAFLVEDKGKRFMQKYHPLFDLAPRDVVARAVFEKQKQGEVYLDMRHKSKQFILKRFPNIYKELQKRGYDLTKDLIPVTPAAHFMCGGIKTDIFGRTSIKNLFAYGEVAATGVHGANRLASNSLLEGMVFSDQIKKCVDELPKKASVIDVIARATNQRSSPPASAARQGRTVATRQSRLGLLRSARNDIRRIMWEYVGLIRTAKGLDFALKQLKDLQKKIQETEDISENILEIKNMVEVAILITKFAKKRKESLGAHFLLKE